MCTSRNGYPSITHSLKRSRATRLVGPSWATTGFAVQEFWEWLIFWERPCRSEPAPPTGQTLFLQFLDFGHVEAYLHHRPAEDFGHLAPSRRSCIIDWPGSDADDFQFSFHLLNFDFGSTLSNLDLWHYNRHTSSLRRLGPGPALPGACRVDLQV